MTLPSASYAGTRVVPDRKRIEQDDCDGPGLVPRIAPCRPAWDPRPNMVELPRRLFGGAWLQRELRGRLGLFPSDEFYARMSALGRAAQELVYLAAVLRETYSPSNLRTIVDAAIFIQPVCDCSSAMWNPSWKSISIKEGAPYGLK